MCIIQFVEREVKNNREKLVLDKAKWGIYNNILCRLVYIIAMPYRKKRRSKGSGE